MEGQRKGCGAGDLKAEENLREENTKYFFKKINIWVTSSPRGQGLPKDQQYPHIPHPEGRDWDTLGSSPYLPPSPSCPVST